MTEPIAIWNNLGMSRYQQALQLKQLKEQADKELFDQRVTNLFTSYNQKGLFN